MQYFQKRENLIRANDQSLAFRFSAGSPLLLFCIANIPTIRFV